MQNLTDRAGRQPKPTACRCNLRGRRGMAVIRAVRARCIPVLPLLNYSSSACVTLMAYPDIIVAPKIVRLPTVVSCPQDRQNGNAVSRWRYRRVKVWTSPARDRIEMG